MRQLMEARVDPRFREVYQTLGPFFADAGFDRSKKVEWMFSGYIYIIYISRKVAVTLPEFSFCFSKNVLTQSCSLSLGEMVPDIFVCWPGGGGPPPLSTPP